MKLVKDVKIPVMIIKNGEKLIITTNGKGYITISCEKDILKVDTTCESLKEAEESLNG